MTAFSELLSQIRIVPVLTVTSEDEALNTCRALQAGGIRAVEITLRTSAALDCIAAVRRNLPEFKVAAGTIKSVQDLERVAAIGVDFAVSPGITPELAKQAEALKVSLLPGVATASELMLGLAAGLNCFKLFPAEAVGGLQLLKALSAPFPEASFCPTGGITPDNFRDYLRLANVLCVGGSWMVSRSLIEQENWEEISRLSELAMGDRV